MDDRENFRKLLGQLQSLKRRIERLENEMDALVNRIATRSGKTRKACLQELLQAIVDEDGGQPLGGST